MRGNSHFEWRRHTAEWLHFELCPRVSYLCEESILSLLGVCRYTPAVHTKCHPSCRHPEKPTPSFPGRAWTWTSVPGHVSLYYGLGKQRQINVNLLGSFLEQKFFCRALLCSFNFSVAFCHFKKPPLSKQLSNHRLFSLIRPFSTAWTQLKQTMWSTSSMSWSHLHLFNQLALNYQKMFLCQITFPEMWS